MTSRDAYLKYGLDSKEIERKYMTLWDVPTELEIGVIPKKIYCNKALIQPLTDVFKELIQTGFVLELKTWDGCYNPRPQRGYEKQFQQYMIMKQYDLAAKYVSMHWFGIAVDVNAAWNGLGKTPTLSPEFVTIWKKHGFDWGGDWKRLDGMHFQLSTF